MVKFEKEFKNNEELSQEPHNKILPEDIAEEYTEPDYPFCFENETKFYQEILDESDTAVLVCQKQSRRILYLNNAAKALAMSKTALSAESCCYKYLMGNDEPCEFCKMDSMNSQELYIEELDIPQYGRTYKLKGKVINWRGEEAFVEYLIDITKETRIKEKMEQEQELLQKRYNEILTMQRLTAQKAVAAYVMNLNDDRIVECRTELEIFKRQKNFTCREFFKSIEKYIANKESLKAYRSCYTVENLKELFKKGITSESVVIKYHMGEGNLAWLSMPVTLMEHPHSGDLMAFTYAVDVTLEKISGDLIGYAGTTIFDLMIYINSVTGKFVSCTTSGTSPVQTDYDQNILGKIKSYEEEYENLIADEIFEKIRMSTIIRELKDKDEYTFITAFKMKCGTTAYKKHSFSYLDEEQIGVAFIRTDITDIHMQERAKNEELVTALALANQANEAKNSFLSSMSHDIRTPMNAIIGMTSIAKKNLNNKRQLEECLEIIENSSNHLLSIINDILDMSRFESGKMVLVKENFDFTVLLKKIESAYSGMTMQKRQKFTMDIEKLVHNSCTGDTQRIQRVLENVLTNSVKFTPEGGEITISVEEEYHNENVLMYKFIIKDTGIGISEEDLEHIFEPFYRAENAVVDNTIDGTGLGLPIVKSIVDAMGGTLKMESTVGKGTETTIAIPLETIGTLAPDKVIRETDANINLAGLNILVVEDQPINMVVAEQLLGMYGAVVDIAENGQLAYDKFISTNGKDYDVIFMDIQMPVMNGYETTQVIRESGHPRALDIPIIAMTANAFVQDIQDCIKCGMNGHVAKPINIKEIAEALKNAGVI